MIGKLCSYVDSVVMGELRQNTQLKWRKIPGEMPITASPP